MKEKKKAACNKGESPAGVERALPQEECAVGAAEKADGPGKGHEKAVPRYTRQQLAASVRFRDRIDLVSALLEEGRQYTVVEADRIVREFMKGKVE